MPATPQRSKTTDSWTTPAARTTRQQTGGHPDRSVGHEWGHRETRTPVRSTTPPTTLVEDSRHCATTRTSTLRANHAMSDAKQLSAEMTATLSAQVEGCLLYTSDAADDLTRVDLG